MYCPEAGIVRRNHSFQCAEDENVLMINIAFIMNGAKPPRGGEFLTLYLITHLRRDIFSPILVYAVEGIIVREIRKTGIETVQIPLGDKMTSIYPREIKLYNPVFILGFLWNVILSGSVFRLNRLLKRNNIQLMYCADNLSKLIGGIAGKMAGIKVVAPCHDDFKEDMLGKTMRVFYLLLLDRILAVSGKVKKFFTRNGCVSEKVVTVYNGINAETFNPENVKDDVRAEIGLNQDAIVIGNIGVLESDKGHKYLFEAMAKLKSEGVSGITCIVCGTGPEEETLKNIVVGKGLVDQVLFLGFRDDIPRILKALDIIVITSLTIESFSMIAVEGMAMKVPVIATNVGGLPEVVDNGRTGILIPPGDIDALCESIRFLVNNPDERLRMGENGRARVLERFTVEENARKTEGVFLEVLGGA